MLSVKAQMTRQWRARVPDKGAVKGERLQVRPILLERTLGMLPGPLGWRAHEPLLRVSLWTELSACSFNPKPFSRAGTGLFMRSSSRTLEPLCVKVRSFCTFLCPEPTHYRHRSMAATPLPTDFAQLIPGPPRSLAVLCSEIFPQRRLPSPDLFRCTPASCQTLATHPGFCSSSDNKL